MDPKQKFMLYAFPFLVVAAVAEALLYRRIRKKPFAFKESGASLLIAVGYQLGSILGFSLTGGVFLWLYEHRILSIAMHTWYHWVLLFLGVEFCYYWFHRASHEIRWFWATHAVHHSPQSINLSAAYRLGWTGSLTGSQFFFAPLVLLGFHPAAVFGMLGMNLLYQFWLHTELIPKLGWIEYIFNTPSHHRAHHATNIRYLDCNYGGIIIIFDRMFGTFVPESEKDPCVYGLLTQVNSYNPVKIAFHEWIKLARDLVTAEKISHIAGYLFGRPGWKPNGQGKTAKQMKAELLLS